MWQLGGEGHTGLWSFHGLGHRTLGRQQEINKLCKLSWGYQVVEGIPSRKTRNYGNSSLAQQEVSGFTLRVAFRGHTIDGQYPA